MRFQEREKVVYCIQLALLFYNFFKSPRFPIGMNLSLTFPLVAYLGLLKVSNIHPPLKLPSYSSVVVAGWLHNL
jgi:hypothetical protein